MRQNYAASKNVWPAFPHHRDTMAETYKTFIRSCTNWKQFGSARKITQDTGLTFAQAKERCEEYNKNLNARQKRKGTRMEFTKE
jgi:hypothetical protein